MLEKVKDKVKNSEAVRIWQKNSAEVDAEREANKGQRRCLVAFIRLTWAVLVVFLVYLIVILAVTYVTPMMVSYIGGLAKITEDTDIFVVLSAWAFPSFLMVMLIFAFTVYLIFKVNSLLRRGFTKIIKKIRSNAALKQKEQSEGNASGSGKKRSKKRKK